MTVSQKSPCNCYTMAVARHNKTTVLFILIFPENTVQQLQNEIVWGGCVINKTVRSSIKMTDKPNRNRTHSSVVPPFEWNFRRSQMVHGLGCAAWLSFNVAKPDGSKERKTIFQIGMGVNDM